MSDRSGDNPILVTGATGFIGSAVVERLVRDGRPVRALARSFTRAPRIARFDIEMVPGDVSDRKALERAIEGCDAVVHCAYDFANPTANVGAAQVLAELATAARVRRLVHLSTISVHEPLPPDGTVDEHTPLPECDWPYTRTKREIEDLLTSFAATGLSITTLRPTIVYGPYSMAWTDGVAKMLRGSRVLIPNGGEGVCNPVYIDDLVEAIVLAVGAPSAAPHPLLITGPDHVTWGRFFEEYENALGTSSVVLGESVTGPDGARWNLRGMIPKPMGVVKGERLRPIRQAVQDRLGPVKVQAIKRGLSRMITAPEEQLAALFSAGAVVSGDAAEQALGFRPVVFFEEGMRRTAKYLQWANL